MMQDMMTPLCVAVIDHNDAAAEALLSAMDYDTKAKCLTNDVNSVSTPN
jgi:hypothetical protein